MSNKYLISHYKSKYRLLPVICTDTNDFPRDPQGGIEDDLEVYISCQYGNKIEAYGLDNSRRMVLQAYIPSIGRGRNIKKALAKQKVEIFDYDESAEEVVFKFKAIDIEPVAELLKAKISGASISPFSTRNLPKAKVEIPLEQIEVYKKISGRLDKSDKLVIHHITTAFLDDILANTLKEKGKRKAFDYRQDMRQLKMATMAKEYIFVKGLFDEYCKYLDKEIDKHLAEKDGAKK